MRLSLAQRPVGSPFKCRSNSPFPLRGLSSACSLLAIACKSSPWAFYLRQRTAHVAPLSMGPIIWGPLNEYIGRRYVSAISFTIYIGTQVGCALSENTASILGIPGGLRYRTIHLITITFFVRTRAVFRFLGGCTAASPLANSGALITDVWDAKTRGQALGFFTLARSLASLGIVV